METHFQFSDTTKPPMGPTRQIQWVRWVLPLGSSGRGEKLQTEPYVPRWRTRGAAHLLPAIRLFTGTVSTSSVHETLF